MRHEFEQGAFAPNQFLNRSFARAFFLLLSTCTMTFAAPSQDGAEAFRTKIRPILEEFCYDCHADGATKGKVAFDELKADDQILDNHELWLKALKNLRAGLMPPSRKPQPSAAQKQTIEAWIKSAVFKADPENPDPGRVTVRRLNRVEYRNTIRDLIGVDFEADKEFPADDSGYGFDDIGDVLTLPPILLEKYFAAARAIVTKAVPSVSAVPQASVVPGHSFRTSTEQPTSTGKRREGKADGALVLSYYQDAAATNTFHAAHQGHYQLGLDFSSTEHFVDNQFDYNRCRFIFKADGQPVFQHDYTREGTKSFHYDFDQDWPAGDHELVVEVHPIPPEEKQVRSLALHLEAVTVRGPVEKEDWVHPSNYRRFFPRDVPEGQADRRQYAREILSDFVQRAYRRPVQAGTIDRLVGLAESTYSNPGKTFETGIGQAMTAVLTSPRFLFREEGVERSTAREPLAGAASREFALVDEFALASRLSYFLWSSMPDDELFQLARRGALRENLASQVERMLSDSRSEELIRNFVGQWLQVRDIDHVQIDARQVLARESSPNPDLEQQRTRLRELRAREEVESLSADEKKELDTLRARLFGPNVRAPRAELNGDLRRAMRLETEKMFAHVLRDDRSLLELLDSDYTFLNERLAKHYGLTNLNVRGEEMRLVTLPPDSPRGGILTQGAILAVTSNPTRTSPVKRGLFVLDNILGTPPPPPPPDLPPLEAAAKGVKDRTLTLRETLALHRKAALCSSCHDRMDPLGLALDNFNALGMWRDQEHGQPIDATGKLLTGESFQDVKELKHILVRNHAAEFYRTVTEKMLTYALGRGLEYYDVVTVDQIVERLQNSGGRASVLISGIIQSAPFQKTRVLPEPQTEASERSTQRADAKTHL